MLRFLAALLSERKSVSPRPARIYFAKFNPTKRSGELIIMNSNNSMRESTAENGKRVAFIVIAALVLTLPLQSQQTVSDIPAGVSGTGSQQGATANQQTQQEIVHELDAMKKRIAQLEATLKAQEQPTPTAIPAVATEQALLSPAAAPAAVAQAHPKRPSLLRPSRSRSPTGPG